MDWARDNAGVSDRDFDNVFRYEERPTTVMRMIVGEKRPEIWSLEGEDEWDKWINSKECPHMGGSLSGLVLILAKRTGERSFGGVKKVQSNDWLDRINAELPGRPNTEKNLTLASLAEKNTAVSLNPGSTSTSGRRSLRTLPFSKDTFRLITKKFYTHNSIARDISRADIPVFSTAEVQMGEPDGTPFPAYVYNCRTTNAWEMDLALTVTHFPHRGLTFAILFGCPLSVEEDIVRRLSFATVEAAHPLLLPGIFSEIERSRHVHLVEATIDEMETRIFELDIQSDRDGMSASESERRKQEKRAAWLDTTYLRNGLLSWNTQLTKISSHADQLNATVFKPSEFEVAASSAKRRYANNTVEKSAPEVKLKSALFSNQSEFSDNSCNEWVNLEKCEQVDEGPHSSKNASDVECECSVEVYKEHMRQVGKKIKHRIEAICDEYDEKIRDCTMRVDGMAMATQWAHGETNVEIALSTSRESKHMRSIALVTMVFLPGTFFASVFSMTFFNWLGSDGTIVSKYIWIYVLVTVLFTALTIGSWWYFVISRPKRLRKPTTEEETPLV